jgi:carboxypeptidase Taq
LQDVHWAMGGMGYFPTYSLGNFLSAQIFATVKSDVPDLDDQIAAGEFKALFSWLESHVWRYGRRYFPQEQIERATGSTLQTAPYIAYLNTKFGELYDA